MASNKQLKERAEALGKQLGVTVDANGKGNQALEELVAELEAAVAGEDRTPVADDALDPAEGESIADTTEPQAAVGGDDASSSAEPNEERAEKAGPKPDPFDPSAEHFVVRGKVITTRKGPIGGGERVLAKDLFRGEAALRELLRTGAVTQS